MTIVGICIGSVVFLVSLTACAFKCYRRQVARNAQNRLSSAIKKGLKESSNGNLKKGQKATIMKSKATSPIFPPSHDIGAHERVVTRSMSTSGGDPNQYKSECYVENEKDGATPEKEECLREKGVDEKTPKLGNMSFSVEYDSQKTALLVTILRVTDLPPRDPNAGGCDPYIKLQLLPEKKHKCKTRVLRKTLNPVYDETFTFYGIPQNLLQNITLHFVILSFDRFSRDEIIGEVIYPLSGVQVDQKEVSLSKEIMPRYLKVSTSAIFG